ncbi:putative Inosine-5'-monophosphate dehydrogenase 1b-like 12, partial [Homarus americanus]
MDSIKRTIHRHRQAGRPKDPSSLQELRTEGEWTMTSGSDPHPFLIHDSEIEARNRIIMFATEEGLRYLEDSDTWYMDETFTCAPSLFEQPCIIRAPLGESRVSCVYAFLPGKSRDIYEEMLTAVHDKGEELGFYMDVTTTITDFEQAALNAFSNKLGPHVNAKACFYHLTQSTWQKIQSLGLSNGYKEDDNIKRFSGMLDGLAFLPVDRISDGIDYIKDNTPDGLDLVDYFDANYVTVTYRRISQTRQISRSCDNASAEDSSIIPTREMEFTIDNEYHTNNLCENWNHGFQQLVGYSHPTIWTAIECIRKNAAIVSMHLTLDARGQPLQNRVRRETRDLQKRLRNL